MQKDYRAPCAEVVRFGNGDMAQVVTASGGSTGGVSVGGNTGIVPADPGETPPSAGN